CALWDEFQPNGSNDLIMHKTFGVAPNRQFWIKWHSITYGAGQFAYNSIVLEETTNNVYVVNMYIPTVVSMYYTTTVGLQLNSSTAIQYGNDSIPLSINQDYNSDNDYHKFEAISLIPNNTGVISMVNPTIP